MPLFVLDTDHVTLFQRGHPTVRERVLALPPDNVVTTMVTVEEQYRGRLAAVSRAGDEPALTGAYERLHVTMEFFRHIPILDFDNLAYERFLSLRKQKIRVGTCDLRIAAIALVIEGVLVTGNAKDFSKVPDLQFEDWSSR